MNLNDDDHLLCITTIVVGILFAIIIICGTIRDVAKAKYQGNSPENPPAQPGISEQQTQVPATKPLTEDVQTP